MAKLVGRRVLHFPDKDGNWVDGVKLQMLVFDSEVEGEACDMPFINKNSPAYNQAMSCPFGEVLVEYDRKGKVIAIVAK